MPQLEVDLRALDWKGNLVKEVDSERININTDSEDVIVVRIVFLYPVRISGSLLFNRSAPSWRRGLRSTVLFALRSSTI